jgi:hypothetical protein
MIKILNIEATHDFIVIEYLTNGIKISTRVYGHDNLTPQEIVEKGYKELKPHIDMECERLGLEIDSELEIVEDEVISINLLGVESINFIEGDTPIEKTFTCTGNTKFGKEIELTDLVTFTPSRTMIIKPIASNTQTIKVEFESLVDEKSFEIIYKSLVDVEVERIAEEARIAEVEANKLPTQEERLTTVETVQDAVVDTLASILGVV